MARLNKKLLRQLIADRYKTQKEFCIAFGRSLPGLHKWLTNDEIRDSTVQELAEWFKVPTKELDLNRQDIDKDRYIKIIQQLEGVAERSGITLGVTELSTWAVFIYSNQSSEEKIDDTAFEMAISARPKT